MRLSDTSFLSAPISDTSENETKDMAFPNFSQIEPSSRTIVSYLHKQQNLDPDSKAVLESHCRDNDTYHGFTTLFLKSLAITNPEEKIYLKVFNFSEEEIDYFYSLNKNLTVEKNYYDSVRSRNDLETMRQKSLFDVIIEQIQKHEKIIYMDVDILVRKSLHRIYDALDKHDAAIQTWKTSGINFDYNTNLPDAELNVPDSIKLCGGVMAFKGEKAFRFLQDWRSVVTKTTPDWWHVQTYLYYVYKKHTENNLISFFDLPQELHDMIFSNESAIWHGNLSINKTKRDNLNLFIKDFNENILTN